MKISGIDEAGLGPILGPYCAALITLNYEKEVRDPRKLCYAVLRKEPQIGKLAVGDSKKIYSSGKILTLEKSVLSFLTLYTGSLPGSADDLLKALIHEEEDRGILTDADPWNSRVRSQKLPLAADPDEILRMSDKLSSQFEKKGLSLDTLKVRMVAPAGFNRLLGSRKNKAAACQAILAPLMTGGVSPEGKLVVDRQGGRRYYGEWLIELFPGQRLTARQESALLSLYQLGDSEILFQVGADGICFETALASMFAKYLREVYMGGLNLYWQSLLPGLKGTAGYYSDGKRFLSDLKDAGLLPEDGTSLIRKK